MNVVNTAASLEQASVDTQHSETSSWDQIQLASSAISHNRSSLDYLGTEELGKGRSEVEIQVFAWDDWVIL